jgi:hypothetical protein
VRDRARFWWRALQLGLGGLNAVSGWLGLAVLVLGAAAGITVPLVFHVSHWLTAVVLLAILVGLVSEGTYRTWSEVDAERQAAVGQADSDRAEVLKLQGDALKALAADRVREAKDQRSEQARQVQMWEERHEQDPRVLPAQRASGTSAPYTVQAFVRNGSPNLIYDVTFRWHLGHRFEGQMPTKPSLPPGEMLDAYSRLPQDFPASGNKDIFGAVAYFRDRNRVCWRAHPDREPEEIAEQEMPVPEASSN